MVSQKDHGFIYAFEPASPGEHTERTLLLLHGTGGSETDLLGLGESIAPGAARLSPRGKVLENGMARFFRRLAAGVFDIDDLIARTHELADFITAAQTTHNIADKELVSVGFSNGANIAGSLLLMYPSLFAGAVLYRPMVPFVPQTLLDLTGKRILVVPGRRDEMISAEQTEELIDLLQQTGADVSIAWQPGGHRLTGDDLVAARTWFGTFNSNP